MVDAAYKMVRSGYIPADGLLRGRKEVQAMNARKIFVVGAVLFFIAGIPLNVLAEGPAKASSKSSASAPALTKMDLNKATAEQLSKCPGITSALAKAIVEYRTKSGPFKAPEDLLKVKGITKEVLNKVKPKTEKNMLYVTPAASEEDEDEPSLKPSKC
jgi:competence protein ComEA